MNARALLRNFTIRTRMLGAIFVVVGLLLLIGGAALLGGARLKALNESFMTHSVHEIDTLADLRVQLGDLRRHEKNMVIDYEDGVAVLKHREAWAASTAQAKKSLEALLDVRLGLAEDGEAAAADFDIGPCAVAALQADGDVRENHFAHVFVSHEAVGHHDVGHFARNASHGVAHQGEADLRVRVVDGPGVEVRRHQGEVVVLADVVRLLARAEALPDSAHHADVFLHARGRGAGPVSREAVLVVALHLRTEADGEAALAHVLDVPGFHGEDGRAAREGDSDARLHFQLRGVRRRERRGEHRVMRCFRRRSEIVAEFFGVLRLLSDVGEPTAAKS